MIYLLHFNKSNKSRIYVWNFDVVFLAIFKGSSCQINGPQHTASEPEISLLTKLVNLIPQIIQLRQFVLKDRHSFNKHLPINRKSN